MHAWSADSLLLSHKSRRQADRTGCHGEMAVAEICRLNFCADKLFNVLVCGAQREFCRSCECTTAAWKLRAVATGVPEPGSS